MRLQSFWIYLTYPSGEGPIDEVAKLGGRRLGRQLDEPPVTFKQPGQFFIQLFFFFSRAASAQSSCLAVARLAAASQATPSPFFVVVCSF